MKYWEIIADNLSKSGWSWGYASVINLAGQTVFIVDAQGDNRKYVVQSDEMLSAFLELERQTLEAARTEFHRKQNSRK